MSEILIIGNLEANPHTIGGQHTRTRNVTELLRRRFGESALDYLDLSQPKIRLFALNFLKVIRSHQIVLMGGRRSLPIFLCLLFLSRKLSATTIVSIGGWLGEMADRNALARKVLLPRTAHIFVETALIRDAVPAAVPRCQISLMPSFNFSPLPLSGDPLRFKRAQLRLLFFSRVCGPKGIFTAVDAVRALHELGLAVTLDIFGPRGDDAGEELTALLNESVRYKGVVPPEQALEIMAQYDVLVFPTVYEGEGFPGVIVDAIRSGTPIVCSDWKSNSEIVTDRKTGIIFSIRTPGALEHALAKLARDRELLQVIGANVRKEVRKYDPEVAAESFLEHIAERIMSKNEH